MKLKKLYPILSILISTFGLIYLTNIIFPITFDDDFHYAKTGNPFILQAQEYLTWHGRYITHTIARIILQFRDPVTNFLTSLLGIFFIYQTFNTIQPNFLKNPKKEDSSLLIITIALMTACIVGSWTAYTQTTFFSSYFLTFTFILLFLTHYIQLIQNHEHAVSYIFIFILGIIAGNSHEQSISLFMFLFLTTIYLKYKNINIPQWYWIGIVGLIIGCVILFGTPVNWNNSRINNYGNANNWLFNGQVYNWNKLGVIKYIYSFLNIMFFGSYPWLIYGTPFFIIFFIILRKNLKIEPDITKPIHIVPILFFIYAWTSIGVMIFSPLFHGGPLNSGLVFLYISIIYILKSHLTLKPQNFNLIKKYSYLAIIITSISWLIQLPTWIHYRQEYNNIVQQIKTAKNNNQDVIFVKPFTQYVISTPWGNIIPVYLFTHDAFYTRMAEYYNISHIKLIDQ